MFRQINGRAVRLLLPLLFSALVTGCVHTVRDPLEGTPRPGDSPIVLSTTTNTGQVHGFDSIVVGRLSNEVILDTDRGVSESFSLNQTKPRLSRDTSLFVGTLPPGEYKLQWMRDSRTGKTLNFGDKNDKLGTFIVRAGTPVDLGRVIITPVNAVAPGTLNWFPVPVIVGRSEQVRSNIALIERHAPQYKELFAAGGQSGWRSPRAESDRVEEYATARPVGISCNTELADGTVIAASRLGTVLVRSSTGVWKSVSNQDLASLWCVTPADLPDAELLAVGEFTTLVRKPPQSDQLVPIDTGDLPRGNLSGIFGNRQAGWYVVLERNAEFGIYHTADIYSGKWRQVVNTPLKYDLMAGEEQLWSWPTPQGFAYTTTDGPINVIDFSSGTRVQHQQPDSRRILSLYAGPNGLLSMLTVLGRAEDFLGGLHFGTARKLHLSKDQGASWTEIEVSFSNKNSAILQTHDGAMLMNAAGGFSVVGLQASRDGGKTWTVLMPQGLSHWMMSLKDGTWLDIDRGAFGSASVQSSRDGGKTWHTEYSNYQSEVIDALVKRWRSQP